MTFIEKDELKRLYFDSTQEAKIWKEDYPAFERLANNDLMDGLDTNLPEVNDGSLAAALYKLPKRIVSSKLSGTVTAMDRDETWMGDLANIQWRNEIIPNANSQAPFARKWKDAVRKAAIYGSVPLVTLFIERDGKRRTDFIVAQPQDVVLEAGKVSDYDSDIVFWEVFYSKTQVRSMIEQAKSEKKSDGDDGYNKWDVKALEDILASGQTDQRDPGNNPRTENDKKKKSGIKFCVAYQRGVNAPFYMYHSGLNVTVREWTNPDPTGDIPVHYLYCYQDFINPYGTGIVKLAGGTQNVLDYMRQADVLATQIGLRPPIAIEGNEEAVDMDSLVYAQDAIWFTGGAKVVRQELSNGIYQQLPDRMAMYKTSLNQLIPTGDTSISSSAGDPQYSKTPAGVKFQQASLSIDDEDFKDNLYMTYEAVAKSMINTHFANMEGVDLMRLSDDEREILRKGGLDFPTDESGEMTNQLEVVWDTARAKFDFEVDPEQDKARADELKLEGLTKAAELIAADPTAIQDMAAVGKKFNKGELYSEMIKLTTNNDKIVTDIGPDDQEAATQGGPQDAEMAQQMQDTQAQAEQAAQENAALKLQLQDKSVTEDQNQQKIDLTAQKQIHDMHMDVVREHNTPDPMEMAKLKSKQDAKAKPKKVAA